MHADLLFKLFDKSVNFGIVIIAIPCALISLGYEAVEPAAKSAWGTTDAFFSDMRIPEGVFDQADEKNTKSKSL